MQKCAFLPGKMQKSGVELGKLKVHVGLGKKNISSATENSNTKGLLDLKKVQKGNFRDLDTF